ncbi:ATP-binding protein [Mesohalobacter halotolerans]|uniref:ATP-binding protein n=1 Tax=Mesohalobacter halotolerans TaxID=1883405 RepID=A0A4U5TTP4_9FLAO|nr:ATP-binding protein [Mesohalobacter halotolerans]TKS57452.1 ATP-binding protein [Mesohalobacter halotolerans]
MINKRLLIKNLLAHNDENSFYDKKLKLDFGSREGKAKFLKHVCAMSNSNPKNNSYLVIGVKDDDNSIVGVDFFDDSKIQNLINAYLENPPLVNYENIPFPHLPADKVVGLVSIRPRNDDSICALRRNIWKYYGGSVFMREGSISKPKVFDIEIKDINSEMVKAIENHSQNNIKMTLDSVFEFMNNSKDFNPTYKVFKEYFVLCWAGKTQKVNNKTYYSRVNIELINEQVKLFYSDQDEVEIDISDDEFKILEYIHLGLQGEYYYYPLEKTSIRFNNNMSYDIESKLVFKPPKFNQKTLRHYMNTNDHLLKKIEKNLSLNKQETIELRYLPSVYLLGYLNGFDDSIEKLESAKSFIKAKSQIAYKKYKDAMRALRKIKYN